MSVSQVKTQMQGGKGNLAPAPKKMTTGLVNERRKLSEHRKAGHVDRD